MKKFEEKWYLNILASLKLLFIHGVFMHNPISPCTTRSSAYIENQGFFHSNCPRIAYHITILSCCLPVSMSGGSVRPCTIRILPISVTEKEPLPISSFQYGLPCKIL